MLRTWTRHQPFTHFGQTVYVLVRVGCEFAYEAEAGCPSLWQVRPRPHELHRLVHEIWEPPSSVQTYVDVFGNECDRLTIPAGSSVLRYDATVEVPEEDDAVDPSASQVAIEDLPDEAFAYLLPSRFCWPDVLYDAAWELFGATGMGAERVLAVTSWVHNALTYKVGASDTKTTALDVFESRAGVCRDYTHLGITFCRALNIPARYVSGYLPDIHVEPPDLAMDFCTWFEAWLGGRWWPFDPRNNSPRIGRVVIARGRDALDTAMVTTWGAPMLLSMKVWADEVFDAN
jgi:transglutaminase-like putative cysteine protease